MAPIAFLAITFLTTSIVPFRLSSEFVRAIFRPIKQMQVYFRARP
jgi:hypothetical protein